MHAVKTVLEAIKEINQSIPGKVTPAETGELLSLTGLTLDEVEEQVRTLFDLKKIKAEPLPSNSREDYGKSISFHSIVAI